MESEKTAVQTVPALTTTLPSAPKKKPFFKKVMSLLKLRLLADWPAKAWHDHKNLKVFS